MDEDGFQRTISPNIQFVPLLWNNNLYFLLAIIRQTLNKRALTWLIMKLRIFHNALLKFEENELLKILTTSFTNVPKKTSSKRHSLVYMIDWQATPKPNINGVRIIMKNIKSPITPTTVLTFGPRFFEALGRLKIWVILDGYILPNDLYGRFLCTIRVFSHKKVQM